MCCGIERAQRCSARHHIGSGHLVVFVYCRLVIPASRVEQWMAYQRSKNSLLSHLGTQALLHTILHDKSSNLSNMRA